MIQARSSVRVGVCPTHLKFVGCLVPDESGALPRDEQGETRILAGIRRLLDGAPVPLSVVQLSVFSGTREQDVVEVMGGIKQLGLVPEVILMIGGVNPMDGADEDRFVELANEALATAKSLEIRSVSSTSFEDWMNTLPRREGGDYEAAVAQVVKAHLRAHRESGLAGSCVGKWQLEFLRPSEFNTFTNIARAWDVVKGLNAELGSNYFRVLVDAAHCGDSGLSLEENRAVIREIGEAGALGCFHASAKTTRGCLSTDDGWIAALLASCAATGGLDTVIVEAFHHQDEALAALRSAVPGHGVDTTDGRSYDQLIIDGMVDVTRRLNNLVARGVLAPA
jgi:hypothetical protein